MSVWAKRHKREEYKSYQRVIPPQGTPRSVGCGDGKWPRRACEVCAAGTVSASARYSPML
jgi:hypothetical protein